MRVLYLLIFALLASPLVSRSQSAGDFRTFQSGAWNNVTTWARFDGTTWVNPAPSTPTSADGAITIRSPHIVTVSAPVTIDQTTVQSGGTITVNSGQVLTVALGSGVDLTNSGTITTTNESQLVFQSSSSYAHARDGGPIPLATWNSLSTCSVTGITITAPTNLNPAGGFYNFIWNCSAQSAVISLEDGLVNVQGDFTIQNTNSQPFELTTATAATPIIVHGNFNILGTSRVVFGLSSTLNLHVVGNFSYTSTNTIGLIITNTGSTTFAVDGSLTVNAPGGTVNFTTSTGASTLNLLGDFTLTAGTFKALSTGTGTINFNKGNGTQAFTNTGSIQNVFNYTIGATTTLDVLGESSLSGSGTLTVNGILRVGSLNGSGAIVSNITNVGNVQTTTRVYASGSKIVYAGLGPQVIGSGHPLSAGVTTQIDAASGVSFNTVAAGNTSANVLTIAGNLILNGGNLNVVSSGTQRALTLNSNVTPNANFITTSGANSDLVINGTGGFGTFPFPPGSQSFRNLTFNRTSSGTMTFANPLTITGTTTISNGTVTFAGTTTLTGTVALSAGTVLAFPGQSLTMSGDFTNSSGFLSADNAATLTLTGATSLTSPLAFSPSGNSLNTLVVNKTNPSGNSATVSSALTVTSALTLSSGQLNIVGSNLILSSGATLSRNGGASISTTSPGGGPWNLVYTGPSLTTGLEIPASGNVTSLTVNTNNPSTVTLAQKVIVAGAFSISAAGSTFTSGNNNVSVGTFTNNGTFNAPSSTATTGLTLLGNFVNNGTFGDNGGTTVVAASLAMTGSTITTTSFNNLTINPAATLTPPTILNLLGNFTDNGGFTAGTGSVSFNGTNGSKIVSGTTNTHFYNLTLNKTNAGLSLSVSSPQTVTNSLTLTSGQLAGTNLSLSNGSTLTRNSAASVVTASPGGGPWNLIYVGGSLTTTLEIPASGSVLSVTVNSNNAATVTLNQNLSVTNSFSNSLSNRTFTSGNNNITTGTFTNGGVFNAPGAGATTGLTLSGNFNNDGVFTNNTGVLVIAGAVTMTGAVINTTNFNDITINAAGNLTPPATLNVQGNFTNNGAFNAGTGTVVFNGTVGSKVLGGSTNTQFYNFTINKSNAGTSLSVSVPETITNALVLGAGQLNIISNKLSMNNGTTLTRLNLSSITTSSPGGGPWNLVYSNGTLTTGLEIPTGGSVLSLTENTITGNQVTLTTNLTVTNAITIVAQPSGPFFSSGAHTVSAGSLVNGGVFIAPTPALNFTLTGDLTNNGTFTPGTGTVVFNGNSHVLGSNTTTFNNLTISSIGQLTGPVNLMVNGNFTNNGSFVAGSNGVTFGGASTQKIQGTTLTTWNNIKVNNTASPSGVSVETNQNLAGTLKLAPNVKFDADGSVNTAVFTVLSLNDHPVQDARIDTLPTTSSVIGNVTVQRYMGPANQDDRFFSVPVATATVAQLQDDFFVTGNFAGTSYPCSGCANNGPSLDYYDETVKGTFQLGYTPTPVNGGSNTEVLVPGRGYDAYLWNDLTPIVLDVSAPINQGTINFTVTRTNSTPPVPSADGWNLLGNPYPSAIEWDTGPGWASNLIDPTVYVWDRQISAERMYNESTGVGNLPFGIIAMGQAFFVYAYPGAPSLSINEKAKVGNQPSTAYYRTRQSPVSYSAVKMSLTDQKSLDESFIVVYEHATPQYDQGMDALKLQTGREAMLIAPIDEEQRKLGFYALNEGYDKDIPLFIKSAKEGSHQIYFTNENDFKGFDQYYLVDSYLGTSSPLSTPYSFVITKNVLTFENRFILSKNPDVTSVKEQTTLSCYPNPTSTSLNIEVNSVDIQGVLFMDNMGRIVGSIPVQSANGISSGALNVSNFSSGLYFVKVMTKDKVLIEKILIR